MSPILPIALAFAALVLVYLRLGWRDIVTGVSLVAVVAGGVLLVQAPTVELAFVLCWAAVIAAASTAIILPQPPRGFALLLAAATGASTGLVAAATGDAVSLLAAAPAALVLLLATAVRWHGLTMLVRVVAAWMVAIALLSATIPLVATPGYRSDHRD